GYLVSPRLIASIAARLMLSGVSKSGSPTDSEITSRPLALRSRAFCVTAMVAEGFTRERTSARKAMGGWRLSVAGKLSGAAIVRRAPRGNPGCEAARGSGVARIPDHGEKGWAVFLQLDRADAMNASQFVEVAGPSLGHLDQRPVGEN